MTLTAASALGGGWPGDADLACDPSAEAARVTRWLVLRSCGRVDDGLPGLADHVGQIQVWPWAPGTVLAMSLAARSVPFGSKPMKQVRRSDVEAWIKSMHAAGLAPGTIKTRYVNVRSVFRAAVKDKVIGSDPTDGVRLPRGRRADAAMSIPTPEEVGQLITVADERFRPFIGLCAFAGLRLGEAAGIQLGDVDFLRKSLKVSSQVQRVNGGAIDVRAPKYGSERVVYLADSLVNVLAEHVANHGTTGEDRWLFAGEGDDPPHQNTVGYWWRKTLRDAGLAGIKLHDLRHFYASGLIAAGCDVVTVQRSLGHAKATTTLNTYAHLWPTAEDRTRKAAESIMSESLGRPAATPAELAANAGE